MILPSLYLYVERRVPRQLLLEFGVGNGAIAALFWICIATLLAFIAGCITRCRGYRATAPLGRSVVESGIELWRFARATEAAWLAAERRSLDTGQRS